MKTSTLRKPVEELYKKGKSQGFITQDDILEVFPDAEKRLDELDEFYGRLLTDGIDVFESVSTEEEFSDKRQLTLDQEIEI